MNFKGFLIVIIVFNIFSSCNKKTIPGKPVYSKSYFLTDSIPESEISIPVQINLKSFFSLAEKKVDTVFASSNWPVDWINIDCSNRYKYHFRRSPLVISASGRSVNMGFTGYYKIIGSTRACIGNAVVSPWTPPCSCGFEEGERRVKVNFENTISVHQDYKIKLSINRQEPEPIDKCTVCFFGADITSLVMKGLKEELDLSKKSILDSFAVLDMKAQAQEIWNKINTAIPIEGLGWFQVNPVKFRLNNYYFKNDSLNILFSMTAKPLIQFDKPSAHKYLLPELENASSKPGFNIFLDALLNYDSLSRIVNAQLKGKQFEFEKGAIRKTVIINEFAIYGSDKENLIIKIVFSGSNSGTAYFTGTPFYNEKTKAIEIRNLDFDIKSKNILLRNVDWMFNKKIINEITNRSKIDLSGYIDSAIALVNKNLNREIISGVKSNGIIEIMPNPKQVIIPLSQHLVIRSNAVGKMEITINNPDLKY